MRRNRRFFALFLAFFAVLSVLILSAGAGHGCHGDDCAVCAVLAATVREAPLLPLILCGIAVSFAGSDGGAFQRAPGGFSPTLVALHTKLSD